ncbi:MAG: DNA repair protein RadC [Myxococcaceae bacterium]
MRTPISDGPRERLLKHGSSILSDIELLTALLGVGTRQHPVVRVSEQLLEKFGGLRGLARVPTLHLLTQHGLGPAMATRLAAALEYGRRALTPERAPRKLSDARDVFAFVAPQLAGLRRENFHVLALNARGVLLRQARVAEGSIDFCAVDPREVFALALHAGASGVVLVHNHPSGDPKPSSADVQLTERLCQGGQLLHIAVLDHVVIGDGRYFSFREQGLLRAMADSRPLRAFPGGSETAKAQIEPS